MKTAGSAKGAAAENLAERFLCAQGLELVERNFRCRGGEIDLILTDGDTMVFVEVRLRSSERFGGAAASIDAKKVARLRLAAQYYLAGRGATPACRFDAVLLDALEGGNIEWLRDIF